MLLLLLLLLLLLVLLLVLFTVVPVATIATNTDAAVPPATISIHKKMTRKQRGSLKKRGKTADMKPRQAGEEQAM